MNAGFFVLFISNFAETLEQGGWGVKSFKNLDFLVNYYMYTVYPVR